VVPATRAEVHIAQNDRVHNRPPGRCGWCALETLARHHGLAAIYGFTANHPFLCSARSLEQSLTHAGVLFRIQYPGSHSRAILNFAIAENLGAAVGLREPSPGVAGHIVTLVDLHDDTVKYIDPNDDDGRTRRMSLQRFLSSWDGLAVVLVPEDKWVLVRPAATDRPTRRSPAEAFPAARLRREFI
jgi:hypothetical protein